MYAFKVGDRVKPRDGNEHVQRRRGTVVEVSEGGSYPRVRVLWDKYGTTLSKRTWWAPHRLSVVISGAPDPFPEPPTDADYLPDVGGES